MPEEDGYVGVCVDFHEYHAFGDFYNVDLAESPDGWQTNLDIACDYAANLVTQTLEVTGNIFNL